MSGNGGVETIQPSAGHSPGGKRFPRELDSQSKRSAQVRSQSIKNVRHFAKWYILNKLRKRNHSDLAERLSNPEDQVEGDSYQLLQTIASQLEKERGMQFEEILNRLQLTSQHLKVTYDTIVGEIFRGGVNWGRIVAFIVFSGSFAVHCAEHGMEARVKDVINWTEEHMDASVRDWILEKGGWEAFMDHYDDESWTIEIPQFLVGAGLAAAVVAGGFFLMKKFF